MDDGIKRLLKNLKDTDPQVREWATHELWENWFWQKGLAGLKSLQQSQASLEAGDLGAAEAVLNDVIQHYPDFAEAWNRRAVLHFTQKQFEQARLDCEAALGLVPFHFGALHGLGLCHASLGNYRAAIHAFHEALAVQPYALINQQLLLECSAKL
ncbi:MAG: tetratricopeptide repeat protein [Thermosynechococcaceae cyanobacterium]